MRPITQPGRGEPQFPKLSDDDWAAFARRTFREAGGRIVPDSM